MLPALPGYVFHDPRDASKRKGQQFKVQFGLMVSKPVPREDVEKQLNEHSQKITLQEPLTTSSISRETFAETRLPAAQPSGVLRFYAYFREDVTESNEETYRVRYVSIMVYLEDNTIMIEEKRQKNSGIEEGRLLRRQRVANPSCAFGEQYICSDFNVGLDMQIGGVVYHTYACDLFTEKYFQEHGWHLNDFETPPDDLFTIKRKLTERPIRVSHVNADKTNLRRFLDYDGKVLRFYCTWDDSKSMFGEKRNFVLIYFLVDGAIQIRQVLPQNSGRDPVACFLKKTILTNPKTNRPYAEDDMYIGQTVEVFGRKFLLYDADQFTKDYLDNKFGVHDWTPLTAEAYKEKVITPTQRIYPPFNGWGDEDDSLGYCKSLHPKPPRKNIVKLLNNDGKVLRFLAVFKYPEPQDVNRKFVVAFFLADDTVAVYEKPTRNSGFPEGKFIQRTKLINKEQGRAFQAQDFSVGATLNINGFIFTLTGADEYSYGYMESYSDEFPQADLQNIVNCLRSNRELVQRMNKVFQSKDPELQGHVKQQDAEMILNSTGLEPQEVTTVLRRWLTDWGFDYFGLISVLSS